MFPKVGRSGCHRSPPPDPDRAESDNPGVEFPHSTVDASSFNFKLYLHQHIEATP